MSKNAPHRYPGSVGRLSYVRYYLDGTAIIRSVEDSAESDALREWLAAHPSELVTSVLSRWQAAEGMAKLDRGQRMRAYDQLGAIPEIPVSGRALEIGSYAVSAVSPYAALHVGLAQAEESVTVVVTYDPEVASAARIYGLRVVTPGRDAGWYVT
ncbi:MAG: PIN domain-containing protein [Bifidobacteriaceae bacterium]|jgi:predicted nucleic acid-binding protein|nr:PIN domain-containing protein [Bifidobacteriaceae bacterium]